MHGRVLEKERQQVQSEYVYYGVPSGLAESNKVLCASLIMPSFSCPVVDPEPWDVLKHAI